MRDLTATPLPTGEVECPNCGTVAVNRDFCACGEYLKWEATLASEADAPAPAPPAAALPEYRPPAPPTRTATLLTLRDPEREDDPGASVAIRVTPGMDVTLVAKIRNQGEIVDTFDLRVDGLPPTWWTISSPTVFLNPWGTSGEYEIETHIRLHPPRTPQAEARAWPLLVVARSRSLGADVASAAARLTVEPFVSTVMHVGPERRGSRRHASFDVAVANQGNSAMEISVVARDSEARCPIAIAPERGLVHVGDSIRSSVRVSVPRPLIVGRPVDHFVDVSHRVAGVEAEPVPQRVTFRQRPWLPWWVPPVVALLGVLLAVLALLERRAEVPKLKGDTVGESLVVLKKRHLKLGHIAHAPGPKGVPLNTVIDQQPAAGDALDKGEMVNITLAAPPATDAVPPVNGLTLAKAADALTAAHLTYNPQPSSAGNDWVVIRQQPTPGTKADRGTAVELAVRAPAPKATPTPTPTPTATPTATPAGGGAGGAAAAAGAGAGGAAKTTKHAVAAASPLPANLVFASAAGRLFQWARRAPKAAPLTDASHHLESPTRTDDGFVAVEVGADGRRLVHVSADGRAIDTLAAGDYYRPVYSKRRGLIATISGGKLCVLDPQDVRTASCAATAAGRPGWSPNGHSLLALAGPDGTYDQLLTFSADGDDATRWSAPAAAYSAAAIQSAVWVANTRIAVLVSDTPSAPAHLRLLAAVHGAFKVLKDFPELTGFELAATGHHLALRRGSSDTGDGPMVLLDLKRARPRVRTLASGINPAWAS